MGVQCAAQKFSEQPVGNAMPAYKPFSYIKNLFMSSSDSHISINLIINK